jgi:superfamily II DNA helicase RecQ
MEEKLESGSPEHGFEDKKKDLKRRAALRWLAGRGMELSVHRCLSGADRRRAALEALCGRRAVLVLARPGLRRFALDLVGGEMLWSSSLEPNLRHDLVARFQSGDSPHLVVEAQDLPALELETDAVVHLGCPPSLSGYARQVHHLAGELGRSACLIWSSSDLRARRHCIDLSWPPPALLEALAALGASAPAESATRVPQILAQAQDFLRMHTSREFNLTELLALVARRRADLEAALAELIAYARSPACRSLALLRTAHLGETGARCGRCDNCRRRRVLDGAEQQVARSILMTVAGARGRLRRSRLTQLLLSDNPLGRALEACPRRSRDQAGSGVAPATGCLRGCSAASAVNFMECLAAEGWLEVESYPSGWVELTELGRRILLEPGADLVANPPVVTPAKPRPPRQPAPAAIRLDPQLQPLQRRLRSVRLRLARRLGVAPFQIFPNRVLVELVQRRPKNAVDLLMVPGFGPWRVDRLGSEVLHAIAQEPPVAVDC